MHGRLEEIRAGGTGAAGMGPKPPAVENTECATSAEEAAKSMVRLVQQVLLAGTITEVDRAVLQGARTMFVELGKTCDELLASSNMVASEPIPIAEQPLASAIPSQPTAVSTSAAKKPRLQTRATRRRMTTEPGQEPQ